MSIATQISRLQGLRNRIVTKLTALGLLSGNGNDLEDCTNAVEAIGGTKAITDTSQTDVASYQYAQVTDANLRSGNIVSGITILGVTGTASMNPPSVNLQTKYLYYGGAAALPSSITPSSGYDGISTVYIERVDANPTLASSNIKSGVTIMGVTGTYGAQQAKSPSLSSLITQGITSHSVSIIPDTNYLLSRVTIPQITSDIDSNITPSNIRRGVTILGVTGEMGIQIYSHTTTYMQVNPSYESSILFDVRNAVSDLNQIFFARVTPRVLPATIGDLADKIILVEMIKANSTTLFTVWRIIITTTVGTYLSYSNTGIDVSLENGYLRFSCGDSNVSFKGDYSLSLYYTN